MPAVSAGLANQQRHPVYGERHRVVDGDEDIREGGADLISIRNLLGDASVQTTSIYLRLATAHLEGELERTHPREREVAREAGRGPEKPPDDELDEG